jgi:hypothetical protein
MADEFGFEPDAEPSNLTVYIIHQQFPEVTGWEAMAVNTTLADAKAHDFRSLRSSG